MSLRSCLLVSIGAGMVLAATPTFASTWPSVDLLAQGAQDSCAAASASAQVSSSATDADLAKCTLAAKLAVADSDRAAALNNRSVLHFERAEYDAAMADSTAALKLDDSLVEAVVNRGSIFLSEHRPDAAAANFTRALTLAPAHPEKIYFNRAMAREDMGDLHGAYADYAEAAQLDPQWDQPQQQLSRFTIVRQKPMS
jgi:tetratricopeptide (TPR) repeat protein